MRARLAAVLLAALMLFGCGPRYHYEVRRDLSVYFSNADEVIEDIRNALRSRWKSVTVTYSSHGNNMADIEAIAAELMDHALAETDRPDEGDYLRQQYGGYEIKYGYTEDNGEYAYELTIIPEYYSTVGQEEKVDEAVREITADIGGSEYERIRAVCDHLKDNVSYDKAAAKSGSNRLKATAYAALIQHRAVCQGYAVAAYRLLRECGIDARIVTGTVTREDGSEEYHAWNLVGLDGKYYELDVTWDDRSGSDEYFLRCAADIPDHRKDDRFMSAEFTAKYPPSEESYDAGKGMVW